ncbi:MAG: PilZ domain-containing protein [Candidatus Theseobacter exili]|nr:PilZ domain-containing protein [Candidatus Theseobacter exili]
MIEQRGFQRRFFQEDERYMIEFVTLPKKFLQKSEVALTLNLSGSGLLFMYNRPLHHGSLMKIKLSIPKRKKPIKLVGKVVRVEPARRHGLFNIAVQFSEITYENRNLIDEFCNDLKEQKKEQQKAEGDDDNNKDYHIYI